MTEPKKTGYDAGSGGSSPVAPVHLVVIGGGALAASMLLNRVFPDAPLTTADISVVVLMVAVLYWLSRAAFRKALTNLRARSRR